MLAECTFVRHSMFQRHLIIRPLPTSIVNSIILFNITEENSQLQLDAYSVNASICAISFLLFIYSLTQIFTNIYLFEQCDIYKKNSLMHVYCESNMEN